MCPQLHFHHQWPPTLRIRTGCIYPPRKSKERVLEGDLPINLAICRLIAGSYIQRVECLLSHGSLRQQIEADSNDDYGFGFSLDCGR